ncbi:DEAD/DEAH box helicase [Neokomagataea anthophila]|uniref:DEAD/DEAH box helicase n=1 Tax=Neokomagataea anthophila TaxID=2826925 RepID=A0ABS5E750_9PROT|nr:DEAD/DEAH box helicase [Neokomagataea anthophila]MBR0559738.1 DEAD/DEAH box helicase [Neokomagataea anthophila]
MIIDKEIYNDRTRYFVISDYSEKDDIKECGFVWSSIFKRWQTYNPSKVIKLLDECEPELAEGLVDDAFRTELQEAVIEYNARIEAEKLAIERAVALSRSVVPSEGFTVPCGQDFAFLPYQLAGIEQALQRPNILIGDEMGLGKTAQAIGAINGSDVQKVLIICTASLSKNWANEIQKFGSRDLSVGFATTKKIDDSDILITTYDVFSRDNEINKQIKNMSFDLLILDECHYVKNAKSKRTKNILGKGGKGGIPAKRRIYMTGTPLMNRPLELWPICNSLAPNIFPDFMYFAKKYCDAFESRYGWDFSGASNLDELNEKLRSSIMIRRVKNDVLKELPKKIRQVIELPVTTKQEKDALKAEQKHKKEYEAYKKQLEELEKNKKDTTTAEYEEQVKNLKSNVGSVLLGEIAKLRKDTAIAKLPQCIQIIKDIIDEEPDQKVIVFAHHKEIIAGLCEGLKDLGVLKIDGSTDKENRQDIVDSFQNDERYKIFVGSIHACSEGLTLTRANRVVFCEIDWTPAKMSQAEDRAHRIGQDSTVFVQHLLLEGSFDADMAQKIAKKQKIIDETME